MKIFDIILSWLTIMTLAASLIVPLEAWPKDIIQEYKGYIVTDKTNLVISKWLKVRQKEPKEGIILKVSDLIYQTWAVGDTIR